MTIRNSKSMRARRAPLRAATSVSGAVLAALYGVRALADQTTTADASSTTAALPEVTVTATAASYPRRTCR